MNKQQRIIDKIEGFLPAKRDAKSLILTFERIERYMKAQKVHLFELEKYMTKNSTKTQYKNFENFFKLYCTAVRKAVLASPKFEECLLEINKNHFLALKKKENPRYWEWNSKIPFSYDLAVEAYNYTFDQYDVNKKRKSTGWDCFWSLVTTKNGKVTGVWLGDTADREYFWEYIYKKFNLPTE